MLTCAWCHQHYWMTVCIQEVTAWTHSSSCKRHTMETEKTFCSQPAHFELWTFFISTFCDLLTWILLSAAEVDQQHHLLSVSDGCFHPSQRSRSVCQTYCMSGSLRNSSLLWLFMCRFIRHQFSQILKNIIQTKLYLFSLCCCCIFLLM